MKSELLGASSEGHLGSSDSPFVSDALAAVTGDYQSAYAASYYSRYDPNKCMWNSSLKTIKLINWRRKRATWHRLTGPGVKRPLFWGGTRLLMQTCLKKKTVGCDNNNNGMQRRDVVWTTSLKFLHFLLVLWLFINASVRFFFFFFIWFVCVIIAARCRPTTVSRRRPTCPAADFTMAHRRRRLTES